jgi:hypothetical protein
MKGPVMHETVNGEILPGTGDNTPTVASRYADDPWRGHQHFPINRSLFPVEKLRPYAGKLVAWAVDGSGILAAGNDMNVLWGWLEEHGHDPSDCVFEVIPPLDGNV